ncbi:MAG: Zn-ribbon domain-containing OB-fold protein [Candidatus Binatia bacterium]|nr:Zn-ribbon domain-containing OB-fold protein [Candidatus Binatia bacterium]
MSEEKQRPPRPRPGITRDTAHFWEGLENGKLLIQKCQPCGELRHPPEPMCPHCQSLEWTTVESKGHGTIYSHVAMHHPPIPAFEYPNVIALIELDEGVRLVSNIIGVPKEKVQIGMQVQAEFVATDPELTLHQFRPVEES